MRYLFAILCGVLAVFFLNCTQSEVEKACSDICAPAEVLFVAEDVEEANICACWNGQAFADETKKLTGAVCEGTCDKRGGVRAFGQIQSICLCEEEKP